MTTVAFAHVVHIFMFISIIKYYGDFVIPRLHESYFYNKWLNAPILILWLIILGLYYRKNFERIINKYDSYARSRIYSFKNILLLLAAYVVPL